jgi:hypothetical protein
MRASMRAGKELEKVPLTISFTMTIEEWRLVEDSIPDYRYPMSKLADLISEAVQNVEKATTIFVDVETGAV